MRHSRLLRVLRRGDVALSAKLNISDPRVVELAGIAGFDAVWICMEHVPNTLTDVENQIRAAKIYDMDVIVRVPRGSYSDVIRPLEMDAAGVMVPHVLNEQDARRVVEHARFFPLGSRSLDGAGADGDYGDSALEEYIRHANEERLLIAQIEDPSAVAEVERIAGVEGIDMLFFGPGDYSLAVGIPGQYDDPRVEDARLRVAQVAREFGLFAGTPASVDDLPRLIDMGYRYFNVSADVPGLGAYFRDSLRAAQQRIDHSRPPTSPKRPAVGAAPTSSSGFDGRPLS